MTTRIWSSFAGRALLTPSLNRPQAAGLFFAALTLGACASQPETQDDFSGPEDDTQAEVEQERTVPVLDAEELTPIEQFEAGDLSFGDPADEGFAPIEEAQILDPEDVEEEVEVPVESPAAVLVDVPTVNPADGQEILESVEPVDEAPKPTEISNNRDGRNRNALGELVTIDHAASVACGNAEVAITDIDEGDVDRAEKKQTAAAEFASSSRTVGMDDWAESLSSSQGADASTLVGFLKACSKAGYEL